jgi:hypothetical protein
MSDAVQGIQHSGTTPGGGDTPQTVGTRQDPVASTPKIVGNPSTQGKTLASTQAAPAPSGVEVQTPNPSELSDPGSRTGPAMPDPGNVGVRTRDFGGE